MSGDPPPPQSRPALRLLWTTLKLGAALGACVLLAVLLLTSSQPVVSPAASLPTTTAAPETPTPGATATAVPVPTRPTDAVLPGHLFYVKGHFIYELHGYDAPRPVTAGADPAVSPDGTRLAYLLPTKNYDDVYLFDLKTEQRTLFLDNQPTNAIDPRTGSSAAAPTWSDDGATLFFSYSNPGAQNPTDGTYDGTDLSITSCPVTGPCTQATARQLSRPAFEGGGDDEPSPRLADPSMLVYTAYGYQTIDGTPRTLGRLAALNPTTGAFLGYLTPSDQSVLDPVWNPLGRALAFVTRTANDQGSSIYVTHFHPEALSAQDYDRQDFDHPTLLVTGHPFAEHPSFSPDGRYLAYVATADDGTFHLFIARVHLGPHPSIGPAQLVRRAGIVDADRLAWMR